jgi:hypothetical protein
MRKNILIVLPYGNLIISEQRTIQLEKIIQTLKKYISILDPNNYKFFICVSEQIEPKTYFNRGQLINIAVNYFTKNIGNPTHIIIHDIDILPNQKLFAQYLTTHNSLSLIPPSPTYKKIYGITLTTGSAIYMTTLQSFINANGFPNNFWGWGGEDNALDKRYKNQNIKLKFNKKGDFISTDIQRKSHQEKMTYLKKNKIRNNCVWELLEEDKKTWKMNGIKQINQLENEIKKETIQDILPNLIIIHLEILLYGDINIVC